jgi:cobalt-zinc-cadmium resistance protein CzcA
MDFKEQAYGRPFFRARRAGLGLYAVAQTPVDAVPDITPAQVVVNTKTGALDPEQIEKTVSFPIETDMSGISNVKDVRSLSKYGLSQVVVIFEDGTDIYWARQQVAERLQGAAGELPKGLSPELAPISTGLGEVSCTRSWPNPARPGRQTREEKDCSPFARSRILSWLPTSSAPSKMSPRWIPPAAIRRKSISSYTRRDWTNMG